MKKRSLHKALLLVAFIVVPFTIMSCVSGTTNQRSSQVQFGVQVDSLNSTQMASNGDEINISQVRFIYGDGGIIFADSTLSLAPNEDQYQQFNVPNRNNQNPILITTGPTQDAPTYNAFIFSIQKATDGSNIDADFTTGSTHYSMIINGSYNGSDFVYNSEVAFKDTLAFTPVKVQEFNQAYSFLVKSNINTWFRNNSGGYLDPTNDENKSVINNQIKQSFTITTNSSVGQ